MGDTGAKLLCYQNEFSLFQKPSVQPFTSLYRVYTLVVCTSIGRVLITFYSPIPLILNIISITIGIKIDKANFSSYILVLLIYKCIYSKIDLISFFFLLRVAKFSRPFLLSCFYILNLSYLRHCNSPYNNPNPHLFSSPR